MESPTTKKDAIIAVAASGFLACWILLAMLSALPGWEILRGLFSAVCHQHPDRCFWLAGKPVAICARCFGIYMGLAAGLLAHCGFRIGEMAARRWLLTGAVMICLDVLMEHAGVYGSVPGLRFLTGLAFGGALAWFVLRGLAQLKWTPAYRRRLNEFK